MISGSIIIESWSISPDASKDKIHLKELFRRVVGYILRNDENFEKLAKHFNVGDVRYGSDLFESMLYHLLQCGNVFVKQDCQVSLLWLIFTSLDPTGHKWIPAEITWIKLFNLNLKFPGYHNKISPGFIYKIPALETVAGVAVRKFEIWRQNMNEFTITKNLVLKDDIFYLKYESHFRGQCNSLIASQS